MATTVTIAQNGYNGEVLEDLLTYTAQGNDTFREGLIHIKAGIQHKYTLPSIKLGDIIQDNVPVPTSTHGAKGSGGENEYTLTERYLIPQDFMVYLEFNPRDYEKYWKFAQPDGNLVFRELDPKIQATMLRLLMDKKNEYIGNAIWTSAKGGTSLAGITVPSNCTVIGGGKEKYFDGFIKRVIDNANAADAETIAGGQVIISGTTELTTGAAVEQALYTMWKKCPKQIRKKAGLSFLIGWDAWDAYDQHISDKQVKYSENTEVNRYRFKGKRIIPIVGIPEHTITLGEFSSGMESNLWMGVDFANDTEVLKVDRLQSNSELFFFQMRMKMDVNIVRPAEVVVHTAYTKS
ncbi:MAG: hypothetical protein EZS26_001032 [Candidatus Ordinivivax streblomastigis]|uniref:Uncharacterized protein n=1 Tax=Candidatus Ordinivivax streblomastigis TaxID=2540710 RepID=A0A5M8P3E2_9BACT|nr:MAG: hypothetical protein EZS26_001032 [Candidatus Ordinivivax streblomastigis]